MLVFLAYGDSIKHNDAGWPHPLTAAPGAPLAAILSAYLQACVGIGRHVPLEPLHLLAIEFLQC